LHRDVDGRPGPAQVACDTVVRRLHSVLRFRESRLDFGQPLFRLHGFRMIRTASRTEDFDRSHFAQAEKKRGPFGAPG
jgi:hypothetical protein